MLPFSREQFISVFVAYNEAVWPMQVVAYLLGAAMVAVLFRPSRTGDRFIAAGLAGMWLWTGIAYHWLFFSEINGAALAFAAAFVVQGAAFAYVGAVRGRLSFGMGSGVGVWLGGAFVLYAAVLYPLIGLWLGHAYPAMPMFGITPCPVTIFTFGLLLLTRSRVSAWVMAIPFAWSLIGGSAAALLDVPQDWMLLVSGIVAVPTIVLRDRTHRPPMTPPQPA